MWLLCWSTWRLRFWRLPAVWQGSTTKKRITARHIMLAIRDDEQLDNFVGKDTVIAGGGVPPHIHPSLLPMKKTAKGDDTRKIAHLQLNRQTQTLALLLAFALELTAD
ncbi:TPA: hypothetical protein ACH3X1_014327 [Trebouxia sp. C0004]